LINGDYTELLDYSSDKCNLSSFF